jgi:hypothetical protein
MCEINIKSVGFYKGFLNSICWNELKVDLE